MTQHPLDRLTGEEIELNRAVLDRAGLIRPATRFPLVTLKEPPKREVLGWEPARPLDRRVRNVLLDRATGAVTEVITSLTKAAVLSARVVDVQCEGQPPIMAEEFEL
ncbi:MAG TPA: histamine oxidase, partial [Trebonia sp.]|nr:histamine oxidase [Trebonia sp.]